MELVRASAEDAERIREAQILAFAELLAKYQDMDTNPGNESVDKIRARLNQDFTFFYIAYVNGEMVGAIRVVDKKNESIPKRISPIFVLPEFNNRGYAQEMIRLAEELHGADNWELDTVLQEEKNCYLYEKVGYKRTDRTEIINDKLTLVFYRKK